MSTGRPAPHSAPPPRTEQTTSSSIVNGTVNQPHLVIPGQGLRLHGPQVPHFPLEGRQCLGANEVLGGFRALLLLLLLRLLFLLHPLPIFETVVGTAAALLPSGFAGAGGACSKKRGGFAVSVHGGTSDKIKIERSRDGGVGSARRGVRSTDHLCARAAEDCGTHRRGRV